MKSFLDPQFRKCFKNLPGTVKQHARKAYALWKNDPYHPSLHFKPIHPTHPVYSVRVSRKWRAVGILKEQSIICFWIGSHEAYNRLTRTL